MSLEFPIGTLVKHKTNDKILFTVINNARLSGLICRTVMDEKIVVERFNYKELIKVKET